jgi:GT2 family glycosyltransferase
LSADCRLSFIIPFHRNLAALERCLDALRDRPPTSEVIVVADGAVEDCRPLAGQHGARVMMRAAKRGPAVARNAAATTATGDVIVFIDADVVISPEAPVRLMQAFQDHPAVDAMFGAYDDHPADPGFTSQYKNLAHAFVHRSSAAAARTFWAGLGAVRRHAFQAVGGFDERFTRPSVEDIDFGYRLTAAGYQVVLDPVLSGCHLKRWTLGSVVLSDVFDRGIPWTQLVLRYGAMSDDLNLRVAYRWSVVLAYVSIVAMGLALYDARFLVAVPLSLAILTALNHRFYRFFYRRRGAAFTARAWVVHLVHHWTNGLSFALGIFLFGAARYVGVRLPGALPTDAWSGTS